MVKIDAASCLLLVLLGPYTILQGSRADFCAQHARALSKETFLCRRNIQGASENDVDIPSASNTALTWAFFMGTSANVRYQVQIRLM